MYDRSEQILSLTGVQGSFRTKKKFDSLFIKILSEKIHGLCFSPYVEQQKPGSTVSEEQIRRRMEQIQPYTNWIRSFSCTDGNELIPRIAHECGIKTLVGAWLGTDQRINEQEIANLIRVAKDGHADLIAVGNEVMYRGDLSEDELLVYMYQVKNQVPDIPMGYVDAYYEFEDCPRITQACDLILANCYPFWEGCSIQYSLLYVKDMYHRALKAANGKRVIITETGWPNLGEEFYGAEPSHENALAYFINIQQWSREEGIEVFYFSSFDEPWKIESEGDVGAYWGLWDKDEQLKY